MEIHNSLESVHGLRPVVTTGIFDGVHLGHQKLLKALTAKGRELQAPTLLITFWPHPHLYFHPDDPDFRLMMSLEEKQLKLKEARIDHLLVLSFNDQMAAMSARHFVEELLVRSLQTRFLLIGDDHRFGKSREGDLAFLQQQGREFGFGVQGMDSLLLGKDRVSSTFIRSCLKAGDLTSANKLLGYRYFLFGRVQKGNQIGTRIGFPTANLACCESLKQIPQDGVYVVEVRWNGVSYGGMLNIGTRPTIGQTNRKTIEVHLFGHSGDLYDEQLQVSFIRKIRDEMRFNNLEELRKQLYLDQKDALEILKKEQGNGNDIETSRL